MKLGGEGSLAGPALPQGERLEKKRAGRHGRLPGPCPRPGSPSDGAPAGHLCWVSLAWFRDGALSWPAAERQPA